LKSWSERRGQFSEFVNGLTGIGWNTFDYILRDVHYPGCLMLFKLDSTKEVFIEKVFGRELNGNRTKYLELLAETGILNEFPRCNQHGDICVHRSELVAAGSKLTRV
jgi:hypothetical protein